MTIFDFYFLSVIFLLQPVCIRGDLTDEEHVKDIVKKTIERFQCLDVLVGKRNVHKGINHNIIKGSYLQSFNDNNLDQHVMLSWHYSQANDSVKNLQIGCNNGNSVPLRNPTKL